MDSNDSRVAVLIKDWERKRMISRVKIKAILADPQKYRELAIRCIIATQAREGIVTTREQAEAAYDKVHNRKINELVARKQNDSTT